MLFKKSNNRDDFKIIEKRPNNQKSEKLRHEVSKTENDGFDDDEKHANPHWKRRRMNNDTHIGSLELTQKGTLTQRLQGPTWLRTQKKTRTTTFPNRWSHRQYLENSEVHDESQELLESLEYEAETQLKTEIKRSLETRQASIEESNDADEEVDLLVFPHDDVEDDDTEMIVQNDSRVAVLDEPNELDEEQAHSATEEEEVDLLVTPRTDTPEPAKNVALGDRSEF